jgi:hypothetical protein
MLSPGQAYESVITVTSPTAPAAATLVISRPDGTTVTESGPWDWTDNGDGTWTTIFIYLLAAPGLHSFSWVTTGPATAPLPDWINVRAYVSMVSMAEIFDHLNKSKTSKNPASTDADELSGFIMAATELVENKAGYCVQRTFTGRTDHARLDQAMEIVIAARPLIAVQRVASTYAGGPVWDNVANPGVLAVDAEAGIVYQPALFPFWWGPWDWQVTAGRPVIPERLIYASKEQVRHLWETQRGGMPPTILQGEQEFTSTTGFTFTVPRRVLEALEQDMVPSL